MLNIRVCEDLQEAREIWRRHWPQDGFFDLWPVRARFQEQFRREPYFIVAEHNGKMEGLLALSWIEEENTYGHFPGETCQGKTWLEQNKILFKDPDVFRELVNPLPESVYIRYLTRKSLPQDQPILTVDELGYLFYPRQHGCCFQSYWDRFSGKSRKKLRRELALLEAQGIAYRYNCSSDVTWMFRKNLNNFGERSYFSDPRFLTAFENLVAWLQANNMLRVTTVTVGGKIAAVDIGAIWRLTYTVLAGATDSDFPGIAKLINFHHMEWACRERLEVVDFLCGDFGWKERFHLERRPLYKLRIGSLQDRRQDEPVERSMAIAG